jgi:hypothetical protein
MPSLTDLFNPTFFMFLGILVLVVALLVVYFESKIRDQNHKIASMLSLVSTLADDVNGLKFGLNQIMIRGGNMVQPQSNNLGNMETKKELIDVSDDEEDEEEEEHHEDSEDEEEYGSEEEEDTAELDSELDVNEDNESNEDNTSNSSKNIKVLKIFEMTNEKPITEENDNFDLEEDDLNCDFESMDELSEIGQEYVEEVLDLSYDESKVLEEQNKEPVISSSDLKTISINLGEEEHTNNDGNGTIDYKKLQLPKLRSIAVEKGIATNSEVSKLKKPDLLKLLGAE